MPKDRGLGAGRVLSSNSMGFFVVRFFGEKSFFRKFFMLGAAVRLYSGWEQQGLREFFAILSLILNLLVRIKQMHIN